MAAAKDSLELWKRREDDEIIVEVDHLGWAVAHDPPRGPYIMFIFLGRTSSDFTKKDGLWLPKSEVKKLDLIPSHRHNTFARLP